MSDPALRDAYRCLQSAFQLIRASIKSVSTVRMIHGAPIGTTEAIVQALHAEAEDMALEWNKTGKVGGKPMPYQGMQAILILCRWMAQKSLETFDLHEVLENMSQEDELTCQQLGGVMAPLAQEHLVYLGVERFLKKLEDSQSVRQLRDMFED